MNYKSSNPTFSNHFWSKQNNNNSKMTILGVFLKSFFCICLLGITAACVWQLFFHGKEIKWFTGGGMFTVIIVSILMIFKRQWAPILVPLYALAKGLVLGGFSAYIHMQYPNYPFMAVGITILVFLIMIVLYKTKLIVLTKRLRNTIVVASVTIFTVYLITFILNFFGIPVSFIWGDNWFALGFNLFAALTASFALLLDIEFIDKQRNSASKDQEWIATWGLLVTLIWLYVEVLRLLRRLTIR